MRSDPARMLSPACDGTAANAIASISFKSASCIAAAAIAHWLPRGALAPGGTLLQTATKQMVRPPLRSFDNAAARFRGGGISCFLLGQQVVSCSRQPLYLQRKLWVENNEVVAFVHAVKQIHQPQCSVS